MMDRRSVAAFWFCIGAAAAPAAAQTVDPTEGARLAETVCSACHLVGPGEMGTGPNEHAPSFAAIAAMPSANELSLKVFLRSSHGKMPNIILSPPEAESVIAYILSLSDK
jgi:mono/diheme cytochrome c family protein